ncbi:MAG: hypothetical protein ACK5UE_11345 [Chitinophagales bacterium]|jgi:hypothetical protein|nr:hypothetical protein [Sphingobacteriales bacterium]
MNVKNLLIGTIAAALVFLFGGWLFYGTLFPNIWPVAEGATPSMMHTTLGCLFSGAALSFIFSKFAGASSSLKTAAINGGVIGALSTLAMHFYMMGTGNCNSMTTALTDAGISFIMYALAGIAIWFTVGKLGGSKD